MRGTRNGFTLLELLVVIAIIAVLVALLFPTARGVYTAALEFQCQNRIGELAKITMAYCAANNENFPNPCTTQTVTATGIRRGWLYGYAPSAPTVSVDEGIFVKQKMLGSKANLVCPVHVANFQMEPYQDAYAAYKTTQKAHVGRKYTTYPIVMSSYAMNEYVWTSVTPFAPRKRRDFSPTHFLFVEEHPTLSRYQDGAILPAAGRDYISDLHHGGGYVACMGGQVLWIGFKEYDDIIADTAPGGQKSRRWDPM